MRRAGLSASAELLGRFQATCATLSWLQCALASCAAQCIVIGPVCGFVTAGEGRAVSEPYYSQRAQCLRLSERFFSFTISF